MIYEILVIVGCIVGLWMGWSFIKPFFTRPVEKPEFIPHEPDLGPEIKYNQIGRVSKGITRENFGTAIPITKKEFVSNEIYEYKLRERIDQKRRDLEDLLIRNKNEDGFSLHARDVLRYEAMIEVLKAMTQV